MLECSRTEIEHLLRARYCLIYTVSHEEGRVEETLRELAAVNQNSRTPEIVSLVHHRGVVGADGTQVNDIRDPIKALRFVEGLEEDTLFVLRDFHPSWGIRSSFGKCGISLGLSTENTKSTLWFSRRFSNSRRVGKGDGRRGLQSSKPRGAGSDRRAGSSGGRASTREAGVLHQSSLPGTRGRCGFKD